MKRTLAITIVALAGGFPPTPAFGELITFVYSGELTLVADRDGVLAGDLAVGQTTTFAGTYTFESTTPDARPGKPNDGVYQGAIADVTGYVSGSSGPLPFSGPLHAPDDTLANYILVSNDVFSFPSDNYSAFALVRFTETPLYFSIEVSDLSASAFEDDSLFVEPPSFESFDIATFGLKTDDDAQLFLSGQLHEFRLVPEPATVCLLGLTAVVAISRLRTRRRAGRRCRINTIGSM